MSSEKTTMSAPVHAVVTQLGFDSPQQPIGYYESGEWKKDGISPEMLSADCVTMFTCIERVSRMMMHSHFRSLHKYPDRWGIAHKSWDGVSTGEISDSDFMRLLDVWEEIAESLEVHESA